MARTPNSEQKKAIEHSGGVLLSAGAGSGKTFVLVEHVVYLIEGFMEKGIFLDKGDFILQLKSYLSKVVLMTFTNEAAGELSLRVHSRIEEKAEESEGYWRYVLDAISSLSISTIHGFCFKLLSAGYFKNFNPSLEILSEVQSKNRVSCLYDEWLETMNENDDFYSLLIMNERQIKAALQAIFDNPELRLYWQEWGGEEKEFDFEKHIFDVASFCGVDLSLAADVIDVEEFEDEKKAKWFPYLVEFEDYLSNVDFKTPEFFKDILEMTAKYGTVMPPRKKGLEVPKERMKFITKLKNFAKSYGEDYINFFEFRKTTVSSWGETFKSAFQYIDENYFKVPGITFSDLEYFVLRGLEDEQTCERIYNDFTYLIIDEFQDTSWIQYDIIKKIINENYERLFCVGDEKQAIYGFRGGELGVFMDCSKKSHRNLTLSNNYRSEEAIIEFNNSFFDELFQLGPGFEGDDKHKIPVVHQCFPSDVKEGGGGVVTQIDVDIDIDADLKRAPSISNTEISEIEAQNILNHIKKLSGEGESSCILYKNLKPSLILIEKMIEEEIPFSAQVKIPNEEDPIISTFISLIEFLVEKTESSKDAVFNIEGVLFYLGGQSPSELESIVKKFKCDIEILGVYISFCNFLSRVGISTSNYDINMKLIKIFCDIALDDLELIWKSLRSFSANKFSIELKYLRSPLVKVMTSHASKGLEFDHVIVGGIHTNGGRINDGLFLGKLPGSFRWKKNIFDKKSYRSPMYIYESFLSKEKEFSETKRLLYVTCTRAVKSLTWFNLKHRLGELSYLSDSWIDGLRICSKNIVKEEINSQREEDKQKLLSLEINSPMFQIDNIGSSIKDGVISLGLISELSVTKLSSLAECPRKFYLQNICRIDVEEVSSYLSTHGEFKEERGISSSSRGTEIHNAISEYIVEGKKFTAEKRKDLNAINFAIEKIDLLSPKFSLESEKRMKFPIFGQMVEGVPDLVLYGKKDLTKLEVWDFKTGKLSKEKLDGYWFQLLCYAYGIFEKNDYLEDVTLKLLFLDEQEILEKHLNRLEVKEYISSVWKKVEDFSLVNESHCEACFCRDLCHYSSTPVAH